MNSSNKGSVFTIFRRRDGLFLFQFRDSRADAGALQFSFFGGGIEEKDVDPIATAKREAFEELNIQILNGEIEIVTQVIHPIRGTPLYICKAKSKILDGRFMVREGAGAVFLSSDEMKTMHSRKCWFTPATAFIVSKILDGSIIVD